jgi:two-component system, LytTR family, response regulator LytT
MKQKILIVEDDELIADDLCCSLQHHGFEIVGVADSYEKALLTVRHQLPDLVILDIRLSGEGTGIDIAREINDRWKIPFIFLSSNFDGTTMNQAIEEVPHSILTKPYKREDLIATVKLALSKGKLEIKENNEAGVSEGSFFVKNEHSYHRVEVEELLFIKGEGNYTKIQLKKERMVLRASLKDFDFLAGRKDLVRVHRSYYVHLKYIDKIDSKFLTVGHFEIPLSGEGKEEILKLVQTVR